MADGSKDDQSIRAILWQGITRIQQDNAERAKTRANILKYYQGIMDDMPSQPNRSEVTSNDIRDIIGWMLPGIIRTFTASGRVVDYLPQETKDEEGADQASDWMTFAFMSRNKGYKIIYESAHDGLLHGQGIIKCWWDETVETEETEHEDLSADELTLLLAEAGDAEVIEANREEEEGTDPETGMPGMVTVYDVKLRRTKSKGKLKFDVVAPEDFGVSGEATEVEGARLVWQRSYMTKSDLLDMGYNKNRVMNLGVTRSFSDDPEVMAREGEDWTFDDDPPEDASTLIEVFECYALIDIDGDGKLEMIKAVCAGGHNSGELLDWEEWSEDRAPYFPIPCEPLPHRWEGMSIAEQIIDIQKLKTYLLRGAVDNSAAHNNPQPVIEEGSILNRNSLLSPKHGQPIVVKKGAQLAITWKETPVITAETLQMLEYCDQIIERRTGVSKMTMALDPEALNNQSATASQLSHEAGYSKIELVARNMAELGFKPLFGYALKLANKYQKASDYIRLRGKYVQVSPAYWNSDMDCIVNVGLGTGSRDRDAMMLTQMMGTQTQIAMALVQNGFAVKAVDYLDKIRSTAVKVAEAAGVRNAEDYYPEFTEEEKAAARKMAMEPKTDPKIAIEQKKLEMEVQIKGADLQLKRMELIEKTNAKRSEMAIEQMKAKLEVEAKRQIEGQKLAASIQTENAQANADMAVQRDKLRNDIILKREEMAMKERLEREKIEKMSQVKRSMKVKRGKDGKMESVEMGGI